MPEALAHGRRTCVPELVAPVFVDRALGQARAGARYVRELLPGRGAGPRAPRPPLAEAGAVAGGRLRGLRRVPRGRSASRATGDFALGEARYSRLLREQGAPPARAPARSASAAGRSTSGSPPSCASSRAAWPGPSDWVERPRTSSTRTTPRPRRRCAWPTRSGPSGRARFLRERELVTLPRGRGVRASSPLRPSSARCWPSRRTRARPPSASSRRGHFFVPFPPDGASPEEVRQRLENNCHAGIPTTAVHEAYPGHHWHLVTMKANPSPVRQTFRTPYFTEGWALYAEHMMREQGFFTDPRHELYQVEALLFRAARIVVDTSLHAGDMTLDEARRLHGRAREPHRADRAGRGRALRRVADPGVGVPRRVPRDPGDARAPSRRRRRPTAPRRSATSTTASPAAAGSPWRWPKPPSAPAPDGARPPAVAPGSAPVSACPRPRRPQASLHAHAPTQDRCVYTGVAPQPAWRRRNVSAHRRARAAVRKPPWGGLTVGTRAPKSHRPRSSSTTSSASPGRRDLLDVQTVGAGPAGTLPLTPEMLLDGPSGDLFGWTQNAGMGWDPRELGAPAVPDPHDPGRHPRARRPADRPRLPHGPLGGRPADAGGRRGAARPRVHPVRRLRHRPVRRPHPGHGRHDGQPALPQRRRPGLPPAHPLAADAQRRPRRRHLRQGPARDDDGAGRHARPARACSCPAA